MNKNLKEIFSGYYVFKRRISKPSLILTGLSQFIKKDDNTFLYSEDGQYISSEGAQEFYQRHEYQWLNESLHIVSHRGTILHVLSFNNNKSFPLKANHQHFCKADTYHLFFTIKNKNVFEMHYQVNGPEKNYEIKTQYSRDKKRVV